MECIVKRRSQFSASHRYWLPELSEAENMQRFGRSANFPGHGHNYVLFISLLGKLDEYGMVQNFSYVKQVITREVINQLDYAYLNEVWPEFQQTLPTTENVARVIWQRLVGYLPLASIQLFEHPKLWAQYQGNGMEAYITIGTHFSAAHRLASPHLSYQENCKIYGKCSRPHGHGHNYHLEVTVRGEIEQRTGMIVDSEALQRVIDNYIVEPLDHTFLNKDIPYFAEIVPTAENIAIYIRNLLHQPIQELGVLLYKVKLNESPNNSCEVYCGEPSSLSAATQRRELVLADL
ncbi:MAG: 6-pyruvoyl tetrahydropterin synthase [Symploca sp. SIO2E9]|nr:6-pyruvoyl tetrahydropterin synthase [Symploca sp. SIO2E9]